jgi:hypothetical protein
LLIGATLLATSGMAHRAGAQAPAEAPSLQQRQKQPAQKQQQQPPAQPAQKQAQPAQPQQAPQAQPAQIDRNGTLILIRTALVALDQANKTGNYSVLRELGAPGFQAGNSTDRLSEIFAPQRAQQLDLAGVVVIEPQLTLLPQIEPNGMLRMAGFFPSVPQQVFFELLFAPVDGRWRLFGMSVRLGSSTPQAPASGAAGKSE